MKTKFLYSLMSAMLVGFVMSLAVGSYGIDVNPILGSIGTAGVLTGAGVIDFIGGVSSAGVLCGLQKEVWVADIVENLFEGHEFVKRSVDDSSYVTNKTVHVPQVGAQPTIVKNRSTFPATIAERTDSELTYSIDNYTTDPIRVRNFDDMQVTYDKRQSVIGEHVSSLGERIGDEIAYAWAPTADAARVLRTTGADTGTMPHSTATGTRKRITKEDVSRLAAKLKKDKFKGKDKTLLLTTEMYYELFEIDELVRADYMGKVALPEGVVNRLFGFDIMVRDTVVRYDEAAAGAKLAVGAADAVTDCLGAIAWHKSAVRSAQGAIDIYFNPDQAEHYGGIMSAEVVFGGSKTRTDGKGIVALAQGYTAP